ncbi:MAG TPA: PA2779 family protein [Deltaproteobacteria bacterium]|nr:PA2779 family protein [Deltaproteobacteria bacterium]
MISLMRNRFLAAFICFHMIFLATSPAFAALIPSVGSSGQAGSEMARDMDTIQRALETKMVQVKLKAYGLSSEEVAAKLPSMTPAQVHTLAQASDDVLAAGDSGLGIIIALLVIVILVIIILKLMNKEIIIRMSSLEGPAVSAPALLC